MHELNETLRARLDAVLDQTCGRLVNGGDHDTRKYIAEKLVEAVRRGTTHLEELTIIAHRALLDRSNRRTG